MVPVVATIIIYSVLVAQIGEEPVAGVVVAGSLVVSGVEDSGWVSSPIVIDVGGLNIKSEKVTSGDGNSNIFMLFLIIKFLNFIMYFRFSGVYTVGVKGMQ